MIHPSRPSASLLYSVRTREHAFRFPIPGILKLRCGTTNYLERRSPYELRNISRRACCRAFLESTIFNCRVYLQLCEKERVSLMDGPMDCDINIRYSSLESPFYKHHTHIDHVATLLPVFSLPSSIYLQEPLSRNIPSSIPSSFMTCRVHCQSVQPNPLTPRPVSNASLGIVHSLALTH